MHTNLFVKQFNLDNANPSSFQSPNTKKMKSKFAKQNTTPITITWNVNAYVKNKKNILKRIKERMRPGEQEFRNFHSFNNFHQVEREDKRILKNGIFHLNLLIYNLFL